MKAFIQIAGIFLCIDIVWQMMELALYGEVHPGVEDTLIGAVLAISIWMNLRES